MLEVAVALGDKIIEDLTVPEFRESFWSFTRELGWPTLALAHLADITGEARFSSQLEEILRYAMDQDVSGELGRIIAHGLLVWSCVFEGADLYQRRTGGRELGVWLEGFLQRVREGLEQIHRQGIPNSPMAAMVMAIGYERTGDLRFLYTGMLDVDDLMDSPYWLYPPNETKPMAIVYRGLIRFLHHAHRAGLLDRLEYPELTMLRQDSG